LNVFISWSGIKSKEVAELLDSWLQCVIQAVEPWMSSKDIDRGALWFSEINEQLQNTSIGIICLTEENKNKPWILFEAGALAKGISESRVCTFLIDLRPEHIGTPLSQFNHTNSTEESMWELVRTLNGSLKDKALKEKILEQVFQTYWPQFEESFKEILEKHPVGEQVIKRSEDEILLEILSSTRTMERRVNKLENTGNVNTYNRKRSIQKGNHTVCKICGIGAVGVRDISESFGYREMKDGRMTPHPMCKKCSSAYIDKNSPII